MVEAWWKWTSIWRAVGFFIFQEEKKQPGRGGIEARVGIVC